MEEKKKLIKDADIDYQALAIELGFSLLDTQEAFDLWYKYIGSKNKGKINLDNWNKG